MDVCRRRLQPLVECATVICLASFGGIERYIILIIIFAHRNDPGSRFILHKIIIISKIRRKPTDDGLGAAVYCNIRSEGGNNNNNVPYAASSGRATMVTAVLYYCYNDIILYRSWRYLDDGDEPDRSSAGIFRKCYLNSNGETHTRTDVMGILSRNNNNNNIIIIRLCDGAPIVRWHKDAVIGYNINVYMYNMEIAYSDAYIVHTSS